MILAMMTTDKLTYTPVRHELGVTSGGHSGIRPSFQMCPSYLFAASLVSGGVRMAEGDAAASVGWPGGVGLPLLRAGVVPVVVAPSWTPCQEVRLETHRSSILDGSVSSEMSEMAPLKSPTVENTNQSAGRLGR